MSSRRKQENPQPRKRLLNAETELLQDTLTCGCCQKAFALSDIVRFIQHKVQSCNKENSFILLEEDEDPKDFDSDRDEPQRLSSVAVGHTRTPISAPICNRKGLHHQHLHLHRNRPRNVDKPVLSDIGKDPAQPPNPPGTPPLSLTVERCKSADHFGRDSKASLDVLASVGPKSEKSRLMNEDSDAVRKKLKHEDIVVKVESKYPYLGSNPKLTADAETNTIVTEPSTYTCSTCKQTFNSAWTLVQHAQHMHGMKIYLVTPYPTGRSSICTPSSGLPPPPSSAPPPPSLIPSGLPLPPVLPVTVNGPSHAHSHPHPHHHHVLPQQSLALENHPALQLLRMPLGDRQFPPTSLGAPSIFARPSSQDFRVDLPGLGSNSENQFHRLNHHNPHGPPLPPLGIGNFEPPNPFGERGPPSLDLDSRTRVPPQMSLAFDHQMDFYSQRLRQLAGATSPTMAPSPRKLTPPFSHPPMSSSSQPSTPTSTPQPTSLALHSSGRTTPSHHNNQHQPQNQAQASSASSTSSSKCGGATDGTTPEDTPKLLKTWKCEFCSKSFRFHSNLVVHRRCHTGEKPYKCPICRHSCSQASKLKRHMKTHTNNGNAAPSSENNSLESPRSTPDSTTTDGKGGQRQRRRREDDVPDGEDGSDGQTADNEEEEEIDDEEDEEDDEDEEELDDEDDLDDSNEVLMAEDLSTKGPTGSTPGSRASPADQTADRKNKIPDNETNNNGTNNSTGTGENEGNDTNDATSKDRERTLPRHSLVGEVMDKIGLSNIQQYHEAYQKALEESGVKTLKNERPLSSGMESNASTGGPTITENGPTKHRREDNNNNHSNSFTNHHGHSIDFGHGFFGAFDHHHHPPTSTHHHHNALEVYGKQRLKMDIGDHLRNVDLWLPSVHAAHKDLFGLNELAVSSDRVRSINKSSSSSESALKSVTPSSLVCRSLSPRPGTSGGGVVVGSSSSLSISGGGGLMVNSHGAKTSTTKEQRRNDTCEFCGKVFKNCSNLTVHRRSHTGEKPYKCELCSYACAQSSKLTRHMKTHGRLGKDVYRCRFCDMPFSVASTLEKHMRKCVVNQNAPTAICYVERDSDSKELS